MGSFNWRRWLQSLLSQRTNTYQRKPSRKLLLEHLEERLAPASLIWTGLGTDDKWSTAANWSGGAPDPTRGDDLIFPTGPTKTSTRNDFTNAIFDSIQFSGSNYTLNGNQITLAKVITPGANPVLGPGFIQAISGTSNNTINLTGLQLGGSAGNREFISVYFGASLTIASPLKGTTGVELTKDQPGTLILTADNSGFTGPITVSQGVLSITNANALGDSSGKTTVAANAQLQLNNLAAPLNETLLLNGLGLTNDGAVLNVAGNNTLAGPVELDTDVTLGTATGTVLTITGQISDLGAGHNLTKEGAGELYLEPLNVIAGNTYRGLTYVNAGIVSIGHPLALGAGGATTNGTVVSSTSLKSGTLSLKYTSDPNLLMDAQYKVLDSSNTQVGFKVPSEILTLNGPGMEGLSQSPTNGARTFGGFGGVTTNMGTLSNQAGNNTWQSPINFWTSSSTVVPSGGGGPGGFYEPVITIGAALNTNLTIDGTISDNGVGLTNNYSFSKVGAGRLILTRASSYTADIDILQGYLNIRDSGALGLSASLGKEAWWGSTLELEADNIPDSVTSIKDSNGNIIVPNYNLSLSSQFDIWLNGSGADNAGALRNISGVNTIGDDTTSLNGINLTSNATITVDPDPDPNGLNNGLDPKNVYDDFSQLIVKGVIHNSGALTKAGRGELVLQNANTYTGTTDIVQGWITVQNDQALGSSNAGTTVEIGTALVLKPLTPTDVINLPENLTLKGTGILSSDPLLNQQGALVSLGGLNTLSGTISLYGSAGIGVEQAPQYTQSELTVTGNMIDATGVGLGTTTLNVPWTNAAETSYLVDTGTSSGTINLSWDMDTIPDSISVYYPPKAQGGTLLYSSGPVIGTAGSPKVIPFGPGSSSLIEIIINEGSTTASTWKFTATVTPTTLAAGGGIVKLGDKRLKLQADNTFTGFVDIKQGVVRAQNDTALGAAASGTVVEAGTALELMGGVPSLTGQYDPNNPTATVGIGLQIRDEHLFLNGSGVAGFVEPDGTTHNINALVNLSQNNTWRGPITLNNSMDIDVEANSRLDLYGVIDDATNLDPLGSDLNKIGGGALSLYGNNTFKGRVDVTEGILNVQSAGALGTASSKDSSNNWIGDTVVHDGASLEVQGSFIIAGEALTVQGQGVPVSTAFPNQWFAQGPAPVSDPTYGSASGRVTGIAANPSNPNIIFLTASGGGAWRTWNGGQTWEPLSDNLATLFSGAITISTSNPNILYLATGAVINTNESYYGRGVYKSTDAGQTWTLLTGLPGNATANPLDRQSVSKVVVDPGNPNLIYAATSNIQANGSTANAAGIWRYDGTTWFNMTASVSNVRATQNGKGAAPPNTPGPDDDFRIVFPASATYSDVALFNGTLYMALGTASGSTVNGVYRTPNPQAALPAWYIGDGAVDSQTGKEFPNKANGGRPNPAAPAPPTPNNGSIKITVVMDPIPAAPAVWDGPTIYAAVATPGGSLYDIQVSTDGGVTWAAVKTSPGNYLGTQGSFDSAILADPRDASGNTVYVAGQFNVLQTIDGGTTWTTITPDSTGYQPLDTYFALAFDASGNLLTGSDGGIWRRDRTTGAWTDLNGNLQITHFWGAASHPTDPSILYGGSQDVGMAKTTGSLDWDSLVSLGAPIINTGFVRVDQTDPNYVYRTFLNISLQRSSDGGTTWSSITGGIGGFSNLHMPYVLDTVNPNRIVAGTSQIYETLNAKDPTAANVQFTALGTLPFGGTVKAIGLATYQGPYTAEPLQVLVGGVLVDNPFRQSLVPNKGSSTYDPDTIYAASGNSLAVTKNHGQNWLLRSPTGLLAASKISDIQVDPANRDHVYLAVSSFGGQQIWETKDAGLTWTNISNDLPDVPAYKVVYDPRSKYLYVGNDIGVFRSRDNGTTWTEFGVGLPNTQVHDLVLNQSLNTLTAGTYGRGMFQLWLDEMPIRSNPTDGEGALRLVSGSSIWAGPINLLANTTITTDGTQDLQNGVSAANLIISGPISGTADITKLGQGTITLAGDNTALQGNIQVQEGVLVARSQQALGTNPASGSATVSISNGAALHIASDITTDKILELSGGGFTFNDHSSGALRNISGSNTYTGPIHLMTSSVTIGVDSGAQLTIQNTSDPAIEDPSGTAGLAKELTGTLILASANTYRGQTLVNQGILHIADSGALGAGGSAASDTEVSNGAQLQIGGGVTIPDEWLVLSGTGIFNTGALINLDGANVWGGPVQLTSLPLTAPTNVSVNILNGSSLVFAGDISDTAPGYDFTKIGLGKLTLKGNNTYRGITYVTAGTVNIQSSTALGAAGTAASETIVSDGAALEIENAGAPINVVNEILILNGKGINPANAGALYNVKGGSASNDNTWNGTIILNTDSYIGADDTTRLNIAGVIKDAWDDPSALPNPIVNLTKVGLGTVSLQGANTYRGQTLVSAGILNVQNASGLGGPINETQVISISDPAGTGTFTLTYNGPGAFPPIATLNTTSTAQQVQDALNIALAGSTTGPVSVTKVGSSFIVVFGGALAGTDIQTMSITYSAGVTASVSSVRDGSRSGTTVAGGATLQLQPTSAAGLAIAGEKLSLNGDGLGNIGALTATVADPGAPGTPWTATWSGTITLGTNVTLGADAGSVLNLNTGMTQAVNGLGVTKVGAGTVQYSGSTANQYSGPTQVNAGTLVLNKTAGIDALQSSSLTVGQVGGSGAAVIWQASDQLPNSTAVTLNSSSSMDLLAASEIMGALSITDATAKLGAGTLAITTLGMTGGTFTLSNAAGLLKLGGNVTAASGTTGAATITGSGKIDLGNTTRTFTVAASGTMNVNAPLLTTNTSDGLVKDGLGLLVLSNQVVYAALPATINKGTLQVNGTLGNITLNGTAPADLATLGGNGTVGTVSGIQGTGSPGASPGILHTGAVTFDSTDTFFVDLNNAALAAGVGYDQVQVQGSLTLNNTQLAGAVAATVGYQDSFTIITVTGTLTGSFAQSPVFIDGQKFNIVYDRVSAVKTVKLVRDKNHADVTLSSSSAGQTSVYSQAFVITATVTPETGSISVPSGPLGDTVLITIKSNDSNNPLYSGYSTPLTLTLQGDGTSTAQFDPQAILNQTLLPGTYTVDATFNAGGVDAVFQTSTAVTLTQFVVKADTKPTLRSSADSFTSTTGATAVFGQPVTMTVTMDPVVAGTRVNGAVAPSGYVRLLLDNQPLVPDQLLDSNGTASFSLPAVTFGLHQITAVYLGDVSGTGDANYNNSTSAAPFSQTVVRANTDVVISQPPPPIVFGNTVTLSAIVSVNSPGFGSPTGTVTFKENGVTIGLPQSVNQVTGEARLDTTALGVGPHSITAIYSGDTNFNGQTSAPITFQIDRRGSQTQVASSFAPQNESTYGQVVIFTASVASIGTAPAQLTGSVNFIIDGGSPVSKTLNNGTATYTPTLLSQGSHTIQVNYLGDSHYSSSNSSVLYYTVDGGSSQITLSGTQNLTKTVGENVNYTATVAAVSPAIGVPTGTVQFLFNNSGNTTVQTVSLTSAMNGRAELNTTSLAAGTYVVTANFISDSGNFDNSTSSQSFNLTVNAASTTTSVAVSTSPAYYGQTVTLTATVQAATAGKPDGSVNFDIYNASTNTQIRHIANVALTSSGSGKMQAVQSVPDLVAGIPTLVSGAYKIIASYNGSTSYTASQSQPSPQGMAAPNLTVLSDPTDTTLVSDHPGAATAYGVTQLTATVTTTIVGQTPSGNVVFTIANGTRPTTTVTVALDSNGIAVLPSSNLHAGTNFVTVKFSDPGNNFGPSPAGTVSVTQIVTSATTTATVSATAGPLSYGQPVTFTAQVAPVNGVVPTGAVTFNIDNGAIIQQKTLDGSGEATFQPSSFLGTGSHHVTVSFTSDTGDYSAPAAVLNPDLSIGLAASNPSVSVVAGGPPYQPGQPITFRATVPPVISGAAVPQGTVSLVIDGAAVYTNFSLDASGNATFSPIPLGSGSHSYRIDYFSSDGTYTSSSSSTQNLNVSAAPTSPVISASPDSPILSDAVVFSAQIQTSGAFIPTGKADLVINSTTVQSGVSVDASGKVTFSAYTFPAVATYSVQVVYHSDNTDNFLSSDASINLKVANARSVTTVGVSASSYTYGESVTFSADVAPQSGTGTAATGTATLFIDGVANSANTNVPLGAAGHVDFTAVMLPVGTHTYSVTYSGDGNYSSSASAKPDSTVVGSPAPATPTAIDAKVNGTSVSSAVYGQSVVISATVPPVANGVTPQGTATLTIRDALSLVKAQQTLTLISGAVEFAPISNLDTGSYTVQVTYNGDGSNYAAGNPATLASGLTITQADTQINVNLPSGAIFANQMVTIGATVQSTSAGASTPTRDVTMIVTNSNNVAVATQTKTLSGGTVQFDAFGPLAVGSYTVSLTYSGDTNFKASSSPTQSSLVISAAPVVFTSTPRSVVSGSSFALQLEYRDANGNKDTSFQGPVTLSISSGPSGAALGGTLTVNFHNGVAQFVNLTANKAGTYIFKAAVALAPDSFSAEVAVTARSLVPTFPSSVNAGLAFALPVQALDILNTPDSNYNQPLTVYLVSGPAGALLNGTVNSTFTKGNANLSLSVTKPGWYTIRLVSGVLSTNISFYSDIAGRLSGGNSTPSYATITTLLPSQGSTGTTTAPPSPITLAALEQLRHDYGFHGPSYTDANNVANSKWFQDRTGAWYYLVKNTDGSIVLYSYSTGAPPQTLSTPSTSVDCTPAWSNPELLFNVPVSLTSTEQADLSTLQYNYGFHGPVYTNANGVANSRWFQDRQGNWFALVVEGSGSAAATAVLKQWQADQGLVAVTPAQNLNVLVWDDMGRLFQAPTAPTATEQADLFQVEDAYGLFNAGINFYQNAGGVLNSKWFQSNGKWYALLARTANGVPVAQLKQWNGASLVAADAVPGLDPTILNRLSPLAYDNPYLLFSATLTSSDVTTLNQYQSSHGFRPVDSYYEGALGIANSKWFVDRDNSVWGVQSNGSLWHVVTAGQAPTQVSLSGAEQITFQKVYQDPGRLFNVKVTLNSTEQTQLSGLQAQNGFHFVGSYYVGAGGYVNSKWFQDMYGNWFFLTTDGTIRSYSTEGIAVKATVNPAVWDNPYLLFYAQG